MSGDEKTKQARPRPTRDEKREQRTKREPDPEREQRKIVTVARALGLTPKAVRAHLRDPGRNRLSPRAAKRIAQVMRDERGPRGRDATRKHSETLATGRDLTELTNDELRAILNERGVAVRSRARKAELIEALQADAEN